MKSYRAWNGGQDVAVARRLVEIQVKAEAGDLAGAERQVTAFLAEAPDDERGLSLLATIQERAGRRDEATATFEKVFRRNPANAAAAAHLAQVAMIAGDPATAVARLAGARGNRNCPAVLHDLAARAELLRGDLDAAIAAWKAASATRPDAAFDFAEASWFLGNAAWSPRHTEAAAAAWDVEQQRDRAGADETRTILVARGLSLRGRADEAASLVRGRKQTAPDLATEAACIQAALAASNGARDAVERTLGALWTEKPSARLVTARCWALAWAGDPEMARGLAASARASLAAPLADALAAELRTVPESFETAGDLLALGLGGAEADNARIGPALRTPAARATSGTSRLALCLLRVVPLVADVAGGTADAETVRWARRELAELARDPELGQRAEVARAALDLAAGRAAAALERLPAVPRGAPGAAEAHWVRGVALERLGRFAEAAGALAASIDAGGPSSVRTAGLVLCLAESGDVKRALATADAELAKRPGDRWISAARAAATMAPDAALRRNAASVALDEAERLLRGTPSDDDLAKIDSLVAAAEDAPRDRRRAMLLRGRLLVARGDTDGAAERARLLVACDPDDPAAIDLMRQAAAEGARRLAQSLAARPDDVDSRLRAAKAFAAAGEVGRALSILDGAPQAEPRVLGRKAAALASLGRFRDAETAYRALLGVRPDDAVARLGLLQVLASSGRDAEAAEGLRALLAPSQAIDVAVPAAVALLTLRTAGAADADRVEAFAAERLAGDGAGFARDVLAAHVMSVRGRFDEAFAAARRLAAQATGSAEPHVIAAVALQRAGQWEASRDAVRAALVADPAHPVARRMLVAADIRCGLAAYMKSDLGGAEASFERAARSGNALDVVAAMLLAGAHVRIGDAGRADACAARLAAGAGHATVEPVFRAIVETSRGDAAGAAKRLADALRDAPTHPMLLAAAVRAQIAAKRPTDAVATCRAARNAGAEHDGFVAYLLGQASSAAGDQAGAVAAYRAAMDEAPTVATYEAAWVRALVAAGRSEEARTYLARAGAAPAAPTFDLLPSYARVLAAASDPDMALTVLVAELAASERVGDRDANLGDLRYEAGDLAGAEQAYEAAVRRAPASFGPYLGLLRVLWRTGRIDDAFRRFEAESRARPDDPVPPTLCGLIAQSRNDRADEERWYRRALEIAPDSVVAANNLADLLSSDPAGRTEAMTLARKALAVAPTTASVLDTHGWLLHLGGDSRGALAQVSLAARLRPGSAAIRMHEAEILAALGQEERARLAWEEVLRIDAKYAETHAPSDRLRAIIGTR